MLYLAHDSMASKTGMLTGFRRKFAACATLSALAASALTGPALAAGPLGPNGSAIRTSDYGVDLHHGPVLGSTRVTGLGGAYVSIAEGVDGTAQNPAAPAMRVPWSVDYLDYELGLGFTAPAALKNQDFFNTGRSTNLSAGTSDGFLFFNPAANLQWGRWGVGLTVNLQQYGVSRTTNPSADQPRLVARFAMTDLAIARQLGGGDYILGIGLRSIAMTLDQLATETTPETELFQAVGGAPTAGLIYAPRNRQYRIAGAFRGAMRTDLITDIETTPEGDVVLSGVPGNPEDLWLPSKLTVPWEANVGLTLQFGPRPLNPRWYDPTRLVARLKRFIDWRRRERSRRLAHELKGADPATRARLRSQRYQEQTIDDRHLEVVELRLRRQLLERSQHLRRRYLLLSMSLLATGPVSKSVGVESFVERVVDRSGERAVFSPRLGVESEVVPKWLKLRAGTYGEPTRSQGGENRMHGTMGFDLKLFAWEGFGLFDPESHLRFGAALDAAKRYLGWGLSLGLFH